MPLSSSLPLKSWLYAAVLAACSMNSQAEISTKELTYRINGNDYTGFMAYDAKKGKRPGILVVHEWWGHNAYARDRAKQLAHEGYTAFALDMYGEGKLADHPNDAKAFMSEVTSNMSLAEQRFDEAYRILQQSPYTLRDDISALGYCFGGAIVLHMARTGRDLDAVFSYHGSLGSALKVPTSGIRAKVRVFTGQSDAMIPAEQVTAFTEEMFNAGADFSVQVYPGVKHSFTNKSADDVAKKFNLPLAYNAEADQDAWQQTMDSLKSVYGK